QIEGERRLRLRGAAGIVIDPQRDGPGPTVGGFREEDIGPRGRAAPSGIREVHHAVRADGHGRLAALVSGGLVDPDHRPEVRRRRSGRGRRGDDAQEGDGDEGDHNREDEYRFESTRARRSKHDTCAPEVAPVCVTVFNPRGTIFKNANQPFPWTWQTRPPGSDIFIPQARLRPRGSMGEARRGTPEGPDRRSRETDHEESEGRTLAERFISAFHLPYALGC